MKYDRCIDIWSKPYSNQWKVFQWSSKKHNKISKSRTTCIQCSFHKNCNINKRYWDQDQKSIQRQHTNSKQYLISYNFVSQYIFKLANKWFHERSTIGVKKKKQQLCWFFLRCLFDFSPSFFNFSLSRCREVINSIKSKRLSKFSITQDLYFLIRLWDNSQRD